MRLIFRWVPLCAFVLAIAGMPPNVAWGLEWGCTLATFNPSMDYDPLSPERPGLNATVPNGIDCTGTPAQKVMVCVHIKTESSGTTRLLAKDNYRLNFGLASDSTGTGFGSSDLYVNESGAAAYATLITIGANGHGIADLPLYMTITPGQWVAPGTYTALVPPVVSLTYGPSAVGRFETYGALGCVAELMRTGSVSTGYNFRATVAPRCDVSDQIPSLNFGTVSNLSANIDVASLVKVRCTATTPYNIRLGIGLWWDNSTDRIWSHNNRRMRMTGTDNYIDYELYQDASRQEAWRSTDTKTMPAGPTNGPWNGPWQEHTIYGRVPARNPPPPVAGTYSDTVIITVTY